MRDSFIPKAGTNTYNRVIQTTKVPTQSLKYRKYIPLRVQKCCWNCCRLKIQMERIIWKFDKIRHYNESLPINISLEFSSLFGKLITTEKITVFKGGDEGLLSFAWPPLTVFYMHSNSQQLSAVMYRKSKSAIQSESFHLSVFVA